MYILAGPERTRDLPVGHRYVVAVVPEGELVVLALGLRRVEHSRATLPTDVLVTVR